MTEGAFTLEVFRNMVSSVAEEMGAALHRTAFSPNIKERKDHSCAVFDPAGRLLAQAEHIPVHLGAMPQTVRVVLERFDLAPGDLVVLNDPFLGGTHLPDISMVSPVYSGGRVVALLASRAHHSDVGGLAPGSLTLATETYQEGLTIPPVLLREKGVYRADVEAIICSNSRSAAERSGDLQAQAGAHAAGERRMLALVERYGAAGLAARSTELMDYSERLTRLAIADMPDGEYSFTDYLDDDGFGTRDIPVAVRVSIRGDAALVDFDGTSGPVQGPLNSPRAVTLSATYYVFRCLTGEDIPANEGATRPLEVRIPEGCLLDARRPRAVAGGNVETSQRVVDALLGALARALPEEVPAASCGTMSNLTIGSVPTSTVGYSYYETIAGGTGGHPRGPGSSGTHSHMTNTMNTPVEALEHAYPLRVKRYGIRRGSGGGGLNRGGDGLVREIEVLEDATVTLIAERRRRAPWGLSGGRPGKRGDDRVRQGKTTRHLPSKVRLDLKAGDSIAVSTPGGGGWGPPAGSEKK
ncbi:MAG TPA: hydantoinase B/oxoprolinase family protein [Candidatus Anoxymicrobiaceae bacterium]